MGKHSVEILNEETSALADVVSLTGTVDGTQTAAVVRLSKLPKKPKDAKLEKQKALARAFEGRRGDIASTGDEVEV